MTAAAALMKRAGPLLSVWLCAACMPTVPAGGFPLPLPSEGKGDTGLIVRVASAPELCKEEVLGIVSARSVATAPDDVLEALRRQSQALGGDRVVDIEARRVDGSWELSGMAARCNDLFLGRDYVVLKTVSVSAALGDERGALAAIAEQARALRAGVIVDVDYEQRDAAGQLHITGKAARYVAHDYYRGVGPGYGGHNAPAGSRPSKPGPPGKPGIVCPDPTSNDPSKAKPAVPGIGNCRGQF